MLTTSVAGFATGLSLIIAIGAQNVFVLRQGLDRRHVGLVVTVCALSDLVLIVLGVGGVGAVVQAEPLVLEVARWRAPPSWPATACWPHGGPSAASSWSSWSRVDGRGGGRSC